MTLEAFQGLLARLPEGIAVSKYVADQTAFPRVVWNEAALRQGYGSNRASDLQVVVAVELVCLITDTEALWDLVALFREAEEPFDAVCGYDEENGWFSCQFNLTLVGAYHGD